MRNVALSAIGTAALAYFDKNAEFANTVQYATQLGALGYTDAKLCKYIAS